MPRAATRPHPRLVKKTDLASALDSIRTHGKNVVPEAVKALRPPARGATERLAKALGRSVPKDLAVWFSKHDGQKGFADGLDPTAPAMQWLSVGDAIRERAALIAHPEKMLPWDDRWLPIIENGGGDFYVYVTAGPEAGAIKFYLHDARRRPLIARSLAEMATKIAHALAARDAPKPSSDVGKLVGPLVDAGAPSLDALKAAPVGTVYYRRALPYKSFWYWLFVKVTKTAWAGASARCKGVSDFSIDAGLSAIRKQVREQAVADWKIDASDLRERLSNAKSFPTGVIAIKGRDPRKDPYFARKKGKLG